MGEIPDGNTSSVLGHENKKTQNIFEKFSDQPEALKKEIERLRKKMKKASDSLEFEEAAKIRDEVKRLQILDLSLSDGSIEKETDAVLDGKVDGKTVH